jgi:brefeldin A-inhibited guanine nucleotide-exchange protein
MVAQGGLTQMVHHVFTRCRRDAKTPLISGTPDIFSPDALAASRTSFSIPSEDAKTFVNTDVGAPGKSKSNASLASLPLQRPAEDAEPDQEPASNDDPNQSQINL